MDETKLRTIAQLQEFLDATPEVSFSDAAIDCTNPTPPLVFARSSSYVWRGQRHDPVAADVNLTTAPYMDAPGMPSFQFMTAQR